MKGYDLDGVLAESPPIASKSWSRMNGLERARRKTSLVEWYESAPTLLAPDDERFVVITARRDTPDVVEATAGWLQVRFGNRVAGLYLLNRPRTLENVVAFKASVLTELSITDFTEDNLTVLKGVHLAAPGVTLWLWRRGMTEREPYPHLK